MLEVFVTFFKLGLFTIGGGVAMIPILSNIMVKDKKWFTEDEMIDIIAICQGLPGVIAINMATYVGFKKRGLIGSFVATFGVILPSFVIIVIIAKGMNFIDGNPYVQGALGGLRAAALGLIIIAVYQVAKGVIKDAFSAIGAVGSFILIAVLKINVVYIIVLFLALGIGYAFLTKSSIDTRGCEKSVSDANERDHQAFVKQRDEQADVIEVYEKNKEGDDE
ncbi:chromate transporter [Mogibacterium neglectum]|uniref:chromate transporter n=1 Tax=Mogibacterium neglectum TaxID=114528 RepID=UPI00272C541D|nr:chromate transporter [Mogibacterium neglectum]WLD76562.1 chromate transporter [Mogibacterium neglectum]